MASKLIGRCVCPIHCGNEAAHVKIKTDKEAGKAAYPYVYCPDCSFMGHTKTERQALALAALTRPEKGLPPPVPVPTPTGKAPPAVIPEPDPVPVPAPTPAAPAKAMPVGLFDLFKGAPHG